MDSVYAACSECGARLHLIRISLDASGFGYTLTISGVPVCSCDRCGTSLMINEHVASLEDIIGAAMNALDSIAPIGHGTLENTATHCRECRTRLPHEIDPNFAHFRNNAPLASGGMNIGVEFHGESLTCSSCGRKHPHMPAVLYHELAKSITRAASLYLDK